VSDAFLQSEVYIIAAPLKCVWRTFETHRASHHAHRHSMAVDYDRRFAELRTQRRVGDIDYSRTRYRLSFVFNATWTIRSRC
jgi:hypothetical protein